MTPQDTLPLVINEERVRIVKKFRGRRVSVSGAMSKPRAEKRLAMLNRKHPHDVYELVPVVICSETPWRAAR